MIDRDRDSSKEQPTFEPAEIILSNLLNDVVCEHIPPDLTNRIVTQFNRVTAAESASSTTNSPATLQERSGSSFSLSDYDEAVAFAESELARGYGLIIPPPVDNTESRYQLADKQLSVWIQRGTMLVAALAACVLAVLLIPPGLQTKPTGAPQNKDIAVLQMDQATRVDQTTVPPQVSNQPNSIAVTVADPDSNDRPFPNERQIANAPDNRVDNAYKPQNSPIIAPNIHEPSSPSKRMLDKEVIGIIDDQLKHLWKRVGVTPQPNIKTELWLERSALAIVGRLPTDAEKEAFRINKSENRNVEYVDKLIASQEFSKRWSELVAGHYLGKRVVGVRSQPGPQLSFVKWIADSLSNKVFVGDIEREMISGPSSDPVVESPSLRTDPAAFWLADILERSEVDHRESSEHLSKKQLEQKNVGLVAAARQTMRIGGNASMVCSQCHDGETGNNDFNNYLASAQTVRGQDSFWKVPASLSGVSLDRRVPGVRALKVMKSSEYFFEDAEGRLKLAVAGPPTQISGNTTRSSLADWFRSSVEPRRAMVELVWNEVFKQPLFPILGLTEEEGKNDRAELRDFLASQMQTGERDLGALIRWMVLSSAFRVDGQKMDSPWYLKATAEQIAEAQKQTRLFASLVSSESPILDSKWTSMNQVATWVKANRSYELNNQALAQGAISPTSPNGLPKTSKPNYSEDQVRFLVSVSKPYRKVSEIADRLAASQMSWPMLLEHAYLVSDSRFPTQNERDESEKLLKDVEQDRAKTLVMIINARLGSN
ncbi:MAG: DUF1549 domain-containing protein [Planctomycetota bacterium]|nr:DUF1549 domain-containing protein [Planctomycetota bacterium]